MRATLAFLLLLLVACPPQPKPKRLDMAPPAPSGGICLENPQISSGDVCRSYFTAEGYACVRCPDAAGCVTTDFLYCIRSADCGGDPACTKQIPEGPLP